MNFGRHIAAGISTIFIVSMGVFLYLIGLMTASGTTQHIVQAITPRIFDQEPTWDGPMAQAALQSDDYFAYAYSAVGTEQEAPPAVLLTAHHLLIADEIAQLFHRYRSDDIEQIIVLSPNHFDLGRDQVQTARLGWETAFGDVYPDEEAIEQLIDAGFAGDDLETIEHEHGVGGIAPFIAHSFEQAQVIPLVIDPDIATGEALMLGQTLAEQFPEAMMVLSIDFVHGLPEYITQSHDTVTAEALLAQDASIRVDADCPSCLQAGMAFAEAQGAHTYQPSYQGSSMSIGVAQDAVDNVSYHLGAYTEGSAQQDAPVALQFVGDIMLDRGVYTFMQRDGVEAPWEYAREMLRGAHLRIGNLEGTISERSTLYTVDPPFQFTFHPDAIDPLLESIDLVSLANNHSHDFGSSGYAETLEWLENFSLPYFGGYYTAEPVYQTEINGMELSFVGYHQFQTSLTDALKAIEAQGNRFTIVMPHWGTEYIHEASSTQRSMAEQMIDAGADLIIGAHPHVVQSVEIIDGVPVIYSLGNFIFDQIDPETYPALVANILIDTEGIQVDLLPISTQGSQPTWYTDEEAQEIWQRIADWSNMSDFSGTLYVN